MRNALDLVRGAVSPRDSVPVLTHFAFKAGRVYGYNGRVCISAPADEIGEMELTVPADKLIAALDRAGDTWTLKVEGPRLVFRSSGLRVSLPTGDITAFPIPDLPPKKARKKLSPGLLAALTRLKPFVGEDATRPWASSVLIRGIEAMATNNIIFVEVSLPQLFPQSCSIPIFAIDELVRIGQEPTHFAVDESAVTFYLPDDCWIRCQLFTEQWPDAKGALKAVWNKAKLTKINAAGLAEAVERVRPFCPDPAHPTIILEGDKVRTVAGDMAAEVTGFKGLGSCSFRVEPLLLVLAEAQKMDLDKWPRVPWTGEGISGVIVGVTL